LLTVHRGFIFTVSLLMTAVYCTQSMGFCRPQPLLFYFINLRLETNFQRDPISLAFTLVLVILVSLIQLLIELKKHKLRIKARNAEKAAEEAHRNLLDARLKLNQGCNVSQSSSNSDQTNESLHSVIMIADTEDKKKTSNALKFARGVVLFAVIPELIFGIVFSLETIQDLRPHGVTAALMLTMGSIVPCLFFISNAKPMKFATEQVSNILQKLVIVFKSPRVAPLNNTP